MGPDHTVLGIPQFHGEGYENWQFRVRSVLKLQECLKVLETEEPSEMDVSRRDWERKNARAEAIIIGCVADSHLQYLRDQPNAKAMWINLKTAFEKAGFASEPSLRRKIQRMKFDDSKNFTDYFVKFDEILCQLTAVNVKLTERDQVGYLLDSLPDSYDPLITALENLKDDELTLAYVKSRLLAEKEKKHEKNYKSEENQLTALYATTRNHQWNYRGNCYKCGKTGHKHYQCDSSEDEEVGKVSVALTSTQQGGNKKNQPW